MQNVDFCLPPSGSGRIHFSGQTLVCLFFRLSRDEPLVAYQGRERVPLVDDLDGY